MYVGQEGGDLCNAERKTKQPQNRSHRPPPNSDTVDHAFGIVRRKCSLQPWRSLVRNSAVARGKCPVSQRTTSATQSTTGPTPGSSTKAIAHRELSQRAPPVSTDLHRAHAEDSDHLARVPKEVRWRDPQCSSKTHEGIAQAAGRRG